MRSLQKQYFQLLIQQKGIALLGVGLAIITAFSGVALLAVSGWFITAAALAGLSLVTAHSFNFFTPGALVRGLSMSRTAGRYGERLASHEATFRIISRLRTRLFRQIAQQNWTESPLNQHASSSKLLQDIQHIESIYLSAAVPALVALATALAFLFSLFLILPPLVFTALPFLFLTLVVVPVLYSTQVTHIEEKLQQSHSNNWLAASKVFTATRTLTLFQQFNHASQDLLQQSQKTDQVEGRNLQRQKLSLILAQISGIAMTIALFAQAVSSYGEQQIGGAYLFMVLLLALGSSEIFLANSPAIAHFSLGMKALRRLEETLQQQPASTCTAHTFIASDHPALELSDISYHYPERTRAGIDNLSFSHEGAGWVWITGASGCGKSTLLHLINQQLLPQKGSIELRGIQQHRIGLMPQQIDLLRASLKDNLCLHQPHSDSEILAALDIVELKQWAQSLPEQLNTWIGDGEWQPSGGEARRLGLARLILQNPDLVLLDEPMAGLDSELAQRIINRLKTNWRDKLVLANTHSTEFISQDDRQFGLASHINH
ncbi:MAG: hypothetical protein CSA61_01345 [Neptuniibacter caesariensis]|uniref:Thiol reductant ABC exporter subunit CydC n=1 Tax=Neptuniibacter caesariensis TaxID=207954 RepID=A0A2G6JB18_NEPCE|nr:MAG: hypothetical protein CSA61_01345 [Neptuniibacter caesariensis]